MADKMDLDQDENPEIFEKQELGMEEMDIDMEDTRPVQEILSELAQQTRDNLHKYNQAVTRLEHVLKNIDEVGTIHITLCGVKRKFQDFIEECALESRERLKKENCVNFGELILKGLHEQM
jgi:hypothetical protein